MAEEWSYVRGGQRFGPVSLEALRQMVSDGTLGREDLVWRPGMENWVNAGSVAEVWQAPEGEIPQAMPAQVVGYAGPAMEGILCTVRGLQMLEKTRPWVRLVSICLWVVVGLIVVGGVITSFADQNPLTGLLMLLMALIYAVPAFFLSRFASRLGQLRTDLRTEVLEQVLDDQRAFWRLVGLLILVVIALYAVGIMSTVVFAFLR